MIPAGVQVFVTLQPVDLRCGFERLAGLVHERLGYDPRGGSLFVFFGKRRTTLKLLFFDGTGLGLFHKKLDRGTFAQLTAPASDATHLEVDETALQALLDGLELEPSAPRVRAPRRRLH
jgi:transposase